MRKRLKAIVSITLAMFLVAAAVPMNAAAGKETFDIFQNADSSFEGVGWSINDNKDYGTGVDCNDYITATTDSERGKDVVTMVKGTNPAPASSLSTTAFIDVEPSQDYMVTFDVKGADAVLSMDSWNDSAYFADSNVAGISDIELVDNGASDAGSLHILQDYQKNYDNGTHNTIMFGQLIKGLSNGTYVLEAMVKGNTAVAGDPTKMGIGAGANWSDGTSDIALSVNHNDWQKVSYEFTVTQAQWIPLMIYAGGYAGADFYIDNITVYAKEDEEKVNLLNNSGFCVDSSATYKLGGYSFDKEGANATAIAFEGAEEEKIPNAWKTVKASFKTADTADTMQLRFSVYNGATGDKLMIDNLSIEKCENLPIYQYQKTAVVDTLRKSTDADADTCGQWYHQSNIGEAFNDTHYIEIATDGAENPGSLHFVQSSTKIEGDLQMGIRKDVPAGTYNVSMRVKGSVALADQAFHLRNGDIALVDLTPQASYGDWTEITGQFTVSEQLYYLQIYFSQYNWGTDYYIDNIRIVNAETGVDIMSGAGDFGKSIPTVDSLQKDTDSGVDSSGKWYHQSNIGNAFNDTHYIEIATDGAENPGSLHFVQSSSQTEGDMQMSIRKDVPAGTYNVSMRVKGSVAMADQTFHLRNGDNALVDLTPQGSYSDWTEITGQFTVSEQLYYLQIYFSQYNWGTDYYIDNIRIVNAETGVDIMSGAGDFSTKVPKVDALKLNTDADADTCGKWYYQTGIGTTFNDTHYIEIAEDGAENPGSLHFVQSSSKTEGDMQMSIRKDVPAGTYNVSMHVKGSVAMADQTFHLRNGDNALVDLTPQGSYGDWTEITGQFTVSEQLYYLQIYFSQYNWGTDYYIDNIRIVNTATGVDIMSGAGDFCQLALQSTGDVVYEATDTACQVASHIQGFHLPETAKVFATLDSYNRIGNAVLIQNTTTEKACISSGGNVTYEGDVVAVSGYFKGDAAGVWVVCTMAGGTQKNVAVEAADITDMGNHWKKFTKTFQCTGVKDVTITFGVDGRGDVIFDELSASISCDIEAGDVNADANINSLDLIRLKRYIANSAEHCISRNTQLSGNEVGDLELVTLRQYLIQEDTYGN